MPRHPGTLRCLGCCKMGRHRGCSGKYTIYSQGQLHDWLSSCLLQLFDCQLYNQKCLLLSTTASICKLKWQMLIFPLSCEWGLNSKYIPNPDIYKLSSLCAKHVYVRHILYILECNVVQGILYSGATYIQWSMASNIMQWWMWDRWKESIHFNSIKFYITF